MYFTRISYIYLRYIYESIYSTNSTVTSNKAYSLLDYKKSKFQIEPVYQNIMKNKQLQVLILAAM